MSGWQHHARCHEIIASNGGTKQVAHRCNQLPDVQIYHRFASQRNIRRLQYHGPSYHQGDKAYDRWRDTRIYRLSERALFCSTRRQF